MIKRGYAIQMTYDVSDTEKQQAEKALLYFTHAIKILDLASDHLNIMKIPFKENNDVTPDALMNARAAIRRFRDQSVNNFNDFKMEAFKCVNAMQSFSSDTQTIKLIKSFISSVNDLEITVNAFVSYFDELQSKEFSQNIIKAIEDIQKQCEEIDEIANDRIKDHITSNILAKSWVDNVSNDLQTKIEKKTPLILDLFNQRQNQLNEEIKNRL
jgi:hypothetical protein